MAGLADVTPGTRVSVRWDSASGARDVVGEVLAVDAGHLRLQPWDRGSVTVPVGEVSAWRHVPPRAVRPSSSPADLERVASRGWPGLETRRLGGWELRAAGGWSQRANSTLPEGDPGVDLDTALAHVESFYGDRGLRPVLQLATRDGDVHPLGAELRRRGWAPGGPAVVMVADLRRFAPDSPCDATWSPLPDAGWLAAYGRPHEVRARVLTAAPAHYLTVAGEAPERPAAIARLARTADWVGLSCLWVDPALRGRGLGASVMAACVARGLGLGARFGYLQVERANEGAHRLYQRLGWSDHHGYAYWARR